MWFLIELRVVLEELLRKAQVEQDADFSRQRRTPRRRDKVANRSVECLSDPSVRVLILDVGVEIAPMRGGPHQREIHVLGNSVVLVYPAAVELDLE